jgi:phosphoglycolate phosphatase
VIEGIAPVLETLSERFPLALATSKSVLFTQPLLDALALAGLFANVSAAAAGDASDDKTAIVGRALEALAALGCARPAMVGDRSFDVEAAHAHGLLAVGVTWGIGSATELRDSGADVLLSRPSELLELAVAEPPAGR